MQTLDTGQQHGVTAIAMHAWEPLVSAVDVNGSVHVMDFTMPLGQQRRNCFHSSTGAPVHDPKAVATRGAPCASVVAAYVLNGTEQPLLMAGAADGAVRIWRRCASRFCPLTVRRAGSFAAVGRVNGLI